MTSTISLIQSHRSIRKFSARAVDAKLFRQILLAGQAAATSSFIQATSIVRVIDSAKRAELVHLTGEQEYVASAAEFLVFCADLYRNQQRVAALGVNADFSWTEQFLAATVDVALFAQNVVIAAESEGLGCCFIGGIRNNPDQVSELLELPDLTYPVFGLCIGYPAQNPDLKPRLPLSVVVHEDRYQSTMEIHEKIDGFDRQVEDYYVKRTKNRLKLNWSQQISKQAQTQSRPFMREFLRNKGFLRK